MAEKSLVNAAAEMLGVAADVPDADDVAAALLDDEVVVLLEDELPQPATKAAATHAGTMARFQLVIRLSPSV